MVTQAQHTGGDLLEAALDAHGGLERWRAASQIRATIRTGGIAFAAKLAHRYVQVLDVRASTRGPSVRFEGYPKAGKRFVFEPDHVWIETDSGAVVEERRDPRSYFPWGRRTFRWDRLDMCYFAGYAVSNYLSAPFMFTRDGFVTRELDAYERRGERLRRLHVTFPDSMPTHCREQIFYFGDDGLVRRLDYTAEPIGPLATAAHLCLSYDRADGLAYADRRRVVPLGPGARPLPGPTLVSLAVEGFAVE